MTFLGRCIVLAAGAALAGCALNPPPEPRPEPAAPPEPAPSSLLAGGPCRGESAALRAELRRAPPDPSPEAQERQLREIAARRLAGDRLEAFLRCRVQMRPPARRPGPRE